MPVSFDDMECSNRTLYVPKWTCYLCMAFLMRYYYCTIILHQEGHTDIACPLWDIQCPIRTFHVVKGHTMRCVGMVCLAIVDIPCAEK